MKRLFSLLIGLIVAALAGGTLLGVEVGVFLIWESSSVAAGSVDSLGAGVVGGVIAVVAFAAGLIVIGLPVFLGLQVLGRLNRWTSAAVGAVAATLAVGVLMVSAEVTDIAILYALFLAPPGALAGWLLWRIGFSQPPRDLTSVANP